MFEDLDTITIPPRTQLGQDVLSTATGAPNHLREFVQRNERHVCAIVADNGSIMFSLKKCFPAVDSALLVHPSVFKGIIEFSDKVKYVAVLVQITVAGRHKLVIIGVTFCGCATGIVSQAVFDLMGDAKHLKSWVEMAGRKNRPFDSASGAERVVFDALVVATIVPAQPKYKKYKAQQYTGVHKRTIHKLPDWLLELPQIIVYDMATALPKATPVSRDNSAGRAE